MLTPRKNLLITGFFTIYINWIIKRHFHKVNFNQPKFDTNRSILLIANHFSWWDGFLLYHINKVIFKKRFHIMVLEESMQKLGFLKYLGAFSVAKNSKSVIESLNYAAALLNDPDNMVVIFPQGKLYSNFSDQLNLEKGVTYISAKARTNFQYMFAATFIEYFEYKKPTVNIYLDCLSVESTEPEEILLKYQTHYKTAKEQQTSIIV